MFGVGVTFRKFEGQSLMQGGNFQKFRKSKFEVGGDFWEISILQEKKNCKYLKNKVLKNYV